MKFLGIEITGGQPRSAGPCPCGSPFLLLRRRADNEPIVVSVSFDGRAVHVERKGELAECPICRRELVVTPLGVAVVGERPAGAPPAVPPQTSARPSGPSPEERIQTRVDADIPLRPGAR